MEYREPKILEVPKTERVVPAVAACQHLDEVKMIRESLKRWVHKDGAACDVGHDRLRRMSVGPGRRGVCLEHAGRQKKEVRGVDRAKHGVATGGDLVQPPC